MEVQTNIATAMETLEGEGAVVKRLFPVRRKMTNYDPFVLWDHFNLTSASGFPEHPHRGFEAITYLFEGAIKHKDNFDNVSTVYSGGAQRFTAGKGMTHSEMPVSGSNSKGIQVWINLPRHLKQIAPDYQQVDQHDLPVEIVDGVRITTIVGAKDSIQLKTSVQYLDIQFLENTHYSLNLPSMHRGFVYAVNEGGRANENDLSQGQAFFFEQAQNELFIEGKAQTQVMVISGVPHKQPIYQHGPYVD
ncbi:MAG: pirin family protein [Pseudomonadota bacterium]